MPDKFGVILGAILFAMLINTVVMIALAIAEYRKMPTPPPFPVCQQRIEP